MKSIQITGLFIVSAALLVGCDQGRKSTPMNPSVTAALQPQQLVPAVNANQIVATTTPVQPVSTQTNNQTSTQFYWEWSYVWSNRPTFTSTYCSPRRRSSLVRYTRSGSTPDRSVRVTRTNSSPSVRTEVKTSSNGSQPSEPTQQLRKVQPPPKAMPPHPVVDVRKQSVQQAPPAKAPRPAVPMQPEAPKQKAPQPAVQPTLVLEEDPQVVARRQECRRVAESLESKTGILRFSEGHLRYRGFCDSVLSDGVRMLEDIEGGRLKVVLNSDLAEPRGVSSCAVILDSYVSVTLEQGLYESIDDLVVDPVDFSRCQTSSGRLEFPPAYAADPANSALNYSWMVVLSQRLAELKQDFSEVYSSENPQAYLKYLVGLVAKSPSYETFLESVQSVEATDDDPFGEGSFGRLLRIRYVHQWLLEYDRYQLAVDIGALANISSEWDVIAKRLTDNLGLQQEIGSTEVSKGFSTMRNFESGDVKHRSAELSDEISEDTGSTFSKIYKSYLSRFRKVLPAEPTPQPVIEDPQSNANLVSAPCEFRSAVEDGSSASSGCVDGMGTTWYLTTEQEQ